jgi:hypothetical protein
MLNMSLPENITENFNANFQENQFQAKYKRLGQYAGNNRIIGRQKPDRK